MREILFRGKSRDTNKWVFGDFVSDACGISHEEYLNEYGDVGYIMTYVIPETVGQFTGLTDKHGKKIFEGDYIFCSQAIEGNFIDKHIEVGYVEMKHGAFGLHRKQGYYRPFKDWLEDYEYEVIGNKHDNPELLKEGANK